MRQTWLMVGALLLIGAIVLGTRGTSVGLIEKPFDQRVKPPALPEPEAVVNRTMLKREGSMDLALAARMGLAHRPRGFRDDCSGFISGVLTGAGVPADASVMQFWELAEYYGVTHLRDVPYIGDLAFFDFTYDRDRNGRVDDLKTHIAIVTDVEPDGTIVMAHRGSKSGRTTIRMNLTIPTEHEDVGGAILNSWLHSEAKSTWGGWHLTGELWSGFASPAPEQHWIYDEVFTQ
jgi:hypothetical protein